MRLSLPEKAHKLIAEQEVPLEIVSIDGPYPVPEEELIVTGIAQCDGETLYVKSTKEGRSWELPSGRVEENETLDEAMRREFREETGYEASTVRPLLVLVWTHSDCAVTQIIYTVKLGEKVDDPVAEIASVEWREDLPELVTFGNLGKDTIEDLLERDLALDESQSFEDILKDIMGSNSKRSLAAGALTGGAVLVGIAHRKLQDNDTEESQDG